MIVQYGEAFFELYLTIITKNHCCVVQVKGVNYTIETLLLDITKEYSSTHNFKLNCLVQDYNVSDDFKPCEDFSLQTAF